MKRAVISLYGYAGLLAVALLAGCASGPASRSVTKDGPPMDMPPNMAELPDTVPQIEPIRQGGPNKPYTVLGKSYNPMTGDVTWRERGKASWYGSKFHGRRTASGELYSMYGMTAAHKTLPIPSYARVRNVRNGKEIIVRVNDRGPFHGDRVIDLSYLAANRLGFVAHGVAEVEVERLTFDEIRTGAWQRGTVMGAESALAQAEGAPVAGEPEVTSPAVVASADVSALPDTAVQPSAAVAQTTAEPVPTDPTPVRAATPAGRGFWVQLAALSRREGVDRLQQRVAADLSGLLPLLAVFREGPHYKLQVGPYATRYEAHTAAQHARRALQLSPLLVERR